jgi:tetratricopeptide (TPR) repeat protein
MRMTTAVTILAVVLGSERGQTGVKPRSDQGQSPIQRALDEGYNLDHDAALATFKAAIAADPTDPTPYRLAAASIWTTLLFEQGAITVEDYLGQARANVQRAQPRADLAASFQSYLQQAETISEQRLKTHPKDADAHYQVGAAYGFAASYTATIEGRVAGSLSPARRAFSEHERALELDPTRKDAGLIVGLYRYAVSEMSIPLRLVAYIAGFGGGKERGLKLVEEAAAYPSDVQSNARFTLILLYNREQRYDDALAVIRTLQAKYPRNRLLWLEAGGTALRAGRPAEARTWLEDGLSRLARDPRPRASGEESRWHYTYGATLVALHDIEPAIRELNIALQSATRDWVRGRVHKELGKLKDLAGNRTGALDEYRQADRLCRSDQDSACTSDIPSLLKRAYR